MVLAGSDSQARRLALGVQLWLFDRGCTIADGVCLILAFFPGCAGGEEAAEAFGRADEPGEREQNAAGDDHRGSDRGIERNRQVNSSDRTGGGMNYAQCEAHWKPLR